MFLELLEEEFAELDEIDNRIAAFFVESCETEEDAVALSEMLGLDGDEGQYLVEELVKHVNSQGRISKRLSRTIRARRAALTTHMSKSQLKLRARKASRTKKKNPMIQVRALRKRRKALRRRKMMGL